MSLYKNNQFKSKDLPLFLKNRHRILSFRIFLSFYPLIRRILYNFTP